MNIRKPNPKDQHAGCLLHDDICIDEQLKAGCQVELFICFNCRDLMEHGQYAAIEEFSNEILNAFSQNYIENKKDIISEGSYSLRLEDSTSDSIIQNKDNDLWGKYNER